MESNLSIAGSGNSDEAGSTPTRTSLTDASSVTPRHHASSAMTASTSSTYGDHSTSSTSGFSSLLRKPMEVSDEFQDAIVNARTVSASKTNAKSRGRLAELTANKLRFQNLGLCGREQELEILSNCLQRLTTTSSTDNSSSSNNNDKNQLVLISGVSGTGKSTLAMSACSTVETKLNGMFVTGKYDYYLRDAPYSGFVQALDELCSRLLQRRATSTEEQNHSSNDDAHSATLTKQIIDVLGVSEAQYLATVIPRLEDLLGNNLQHKQQQIEKEQAAPARNSLTPASTQELESKSQQLNYSFRKFLRFICSQFGPLVILLDDLQWADVKSLHLMELLLSDRDNSQFMIIGSYRSNEVSETSVLSITLRSLQDKCRPDSSQPHPQDNTTTGAFSLTEIPVGNLDVTAINHVLMTLLSIDEESQTLDLAETCFQRTSGNAFFLIQFAVMLTERKLLEFHLGTWKWKWDISDIASQTVSTENVVDLLVEKMRHYSLEMRQFLQYFACLGSRLDEHVMDIVWKTTTKSTTTEKSSTSSTTSDYKLLLEEAVQEKFLEPLGPGRYQWVHDKVQEAAMSMIPENELASLKFEIGMALLSSLESSGDNLQQIADSMLFVIANLLNSKDPQRVVEEEKKKQNSGDANDDHLVIMNEIARLNLRAAAKAKETSAFATASVYANAGIKRLQHDDYEDSWKCHFQLTLDLYSTAAEAEGILGRTESMEAYAQEVLKRASSIMDKLRVYHILIETYGSDGRFQEAADISLSVLDQLGCKFPKSASGQAIKAIATLMKIKNERNIPTPEDIRRLENMRDPKKIESMKLMKRLGTLCFKVQNPLLMTLVLRRQMRWTIKYGKSAYSPPGFSGYGTILTAVFGDFGTAVKYADNALLILESLHDKTFESATIWGAYYFILPWRQPLHDSLKPFLHGFEAGMRAGDTESAMQCLSFFIQSSLLTGKPLTAINEDCRIMIAQMEELQRLDLADVSRAFWQAVRNLIGANDSDYKVLAGDVAQADAILEKARANKNLKFMTTVVQGMESFLYAYLGEHELGAELAIRKGDQYIKEFAGIAFGMVETFCRGICLYAMARKTKKRKFKKHAKHVLQTMQQWVDIGNPNVVHHLCILKAEQAALDGKPDLARESYRKAVTLSARGGYLQDAAITNERYFDFLLLHAKDTQAALFQLKESMRFYSEWGAAQKVKLLQEQHMSLLQTATTGLPAEIGRSSTIDKSKDISLDLELTSAFQSALTL